MTLPFGELLLVTVIMKVGLEINNEENNSISINKCCNVRSYVSIFNWKLSNFVNLMEKKS